MKIYVAGGSAELDLITEHMNLLRAHGHVITHDWVAEIRAAGEANPRQAALEDRQDWSEADLNGVDEAELVWVILPERQSFGCAFEAGFAMRNGTDLIFSGDWRRSIFTSLALACFDTHANVHEWIRLLRTPGSWETEMAALEARLEAR